MLHAVYVGCSCGTTKLELTGQPGLRLINAKREHTACEGRRGQLQQHVKEPITNMKNPARKGRPCENWQYLEFKTLLIQIQQSTRQLHKKLGQETAVQYAIARYARPTGPRGTTAGNQALQRLTTAKGHQDPIFFGLQQQPDNENDLLKLLEYMSTHHIRLASRERKNVPENCPTCIDSSFPRVNGPAPSYLEPKSR